MIWRNSFALILSPAFQRRLVWRKIALWSMPEEVCEKHHVN